MRTQPDSPRPGRGLFRRAAHRIRLHVARNGVAYVALFIAMSGTAYAAATIGSSDVIDGSLRGSDVRDGSLTGRDLADRSVGVNDLAPQEAWIGVQARIGFAPVGYDGAAWWEDYGSGHQVAGVHKDRNGTVTIRGLIKNTTNIGESWGCSQRILRLPRGYRPAARELFAQIERPTTAGSAEAHVVRVNVDPDGWVSRCEPRAFPAGSWLSLSGMSFAAAPQIADIPGTVVARVQVPDENPGGGTMHADASDSFPGGAAIVKYEWDVQADGTWDATTSTPFYSVPCPAVKKVAVRLTMVGGKTATATSNTMSACFFA
jgi:hypothetical protein